MRSAQSGRWLWWWAPALVVLASLWWIAADSSPTAGAAATATTASASTPPFARTPPVAASGAASAAPFSSAGLQARQAQREIWQQRLERAREALDAYRRSTRYPFESQPAADHPDQMHPNQPIGEEHALKLAGRKAEGLSLRTTQERVFVQGQESVRFTISLRNAAGQPQPLRVLRAWAHEVPAVRTAATYADVALNLNDEGVAGDLVAADGTYGMQLQPASQGFANLLGQIRVEAVLQVSGEQGQTYFDIFYTPEPPAVWQGGVREAMEDGSLGFYLKAEVKQAGRYVVTGRVDDADGTPFALLGFNDEVTAGVHEFRLRVFGKLVRDAKPKFPLTLRDVDGFLVRPDSFPDRMLMPRLSGKVHASGTYGLASFSEAEWSSEERQRYLTELSSDVAQAQAKVEQLGRP